ncbi:hypothetical protein BCR33DRAFT_521616 [Rhizoclosmatium globosum]|uniref:IBR domain-containing protein n=1 Tax=Rhizoclosmatium globosum TaxID=329046 RepID=A0A1Y2BEJ9_9FUNG|nr:hypothetical protein BCR33DRAFT_521616 [Rhizoclosmatium globosum]|eukprot:ORY33268.1 hypothetical protein BCR33DRAFT_521616 [Rhizoclosmatium globosum]
MNLMLEQFLHDSPNLIRCPSRTCDNAISFSGKVKKSPRPLCAQPDSLESYTPVSCTCGASFCFNCHIPNHDPAPCEVVRHSQTKVKNMLLFVLLKSKYRIFRSLTHINSYMN